MKLGALLSILLLLGSEGLLAGAETDTNESRKLRVLTFFEPSLHNPTENSPAGLGVDLALVEAEREVEVIHYRASRNVSELAIQVSEAIEQHRPSFIIGGLTSNSAFVIGDVAESNKIPMITPLATHPAITENRNYSFRVCFDDHYQADQLASLIGEDRSLSRGLILFNTTETFSVGFQRAFEASAQRWGIQELHSKGFSDEKELTDSVIKGLLESKPQFVVIPSYSVEVAAILSRFFRIGATDLEFFGPDSWGTGELIFRSFSDSTEASPKAFFLSHWAREYQSESNLRFLELLGRPEVQERLSRQSGGLSQAVALAFDSMNAVLAAVEIKESKGLNAKRALSQVSFEGATGQIKLETGSSTKEGVQVYQFSSQGPQFYKSLMRAQPQ
ncbi:MAG: hypothetical protein EA369_07550 [Bradymonadales bacterium]|nr:MAG: hypothetical protein EA369_07550 [Bradymonadales bacterium]